MVSGGGIPDVADGTSGAMHHLAAPNRNATAMQTKESAIKRDSAQRTEQRTRMAHSAQRQRTADREQKQRTVAQPSSSETIRAAYQTVRKKRQTRNL